MPNMEADDMSESTELSVCPVPEKPAGALADFQRAALSVPVESMRLGLAEYEERRQTFREWLLRQIVEGIHYGVPPGCEPRGNTPDPKQWRHKPSLYKAGADFMCDLMGVREEYAADMNAWQQLGSPKETFVIGCTLWSKATGEQLGHGIGARTVGEKKMGVNATLKMAEKSAKVAAVLNAWGLADLFSQDLEDDEPHLKRHDNPRHNPDTPPAGPRAVRLTRETALSHIARLGKLWVRIEDDAHGREWKDDTPENKAAKRAAWLAFVGTATGCDLLANPDAWTTRHVEQVEAALSRMEGA